MKLKSLALLLAVLLPAAAWPHSASNAYLWLHSDPASQVINGRLELALRDLDYAISLDTNNDHSLTWGEVRTQQTVLFGYALDRVHLRNAGSDCPVSPGQVLIDHHADEAYWVLRFNANCVTTVSSLQVDYHLLFDLDPQHRGLASLELGDSVQNAVFSPQQAQQTFTAGGNSRIQQFREFLFDGIHHLTTGYDHMLFLFCLLIVVVVKRDRAGHWLPVPRFGQALGDTLKLVTAFTVAHSLTLGLATTGLISLPSRWVEVAIATSVLAVALNNLAPIFRGRGWWVALFLGLIHGFGFATVLQGLGNNGHGWLLSLIAFNLGVEIGQLMVVAAVLPLLYLLRGWLLYPGVVIRSGSVIASVIATTWIVQRTGFWH